jgi:ribA/ribD-fused uncharacterized protein
MSGKRSAAINAKEKMLKKSRVSESDDEDDIFYSTKGSWGFMSNFSAHPITVDGVHYKTSEHYYQCQKTTSSAYRELIRLAPKPLDAAKLGRSTDCELVPNWDGIKISVMEKVLREKLRCNPVLKEALLKSGDRLLIEASPKDPFWGWGKNRNGENHLGKLWMKLREELKSAK